MIVVTGGAGFIGTNLCAALDDAVILDRQNGRDLTDWRSLELLDGADAVVHLAANADVRAGWEHPDVDLQAGPLTTNHLLKAMRTFGVKRLIFASTGSVYHPASHPHDELCPIHATSLYAASKIASEQLIAAWANAEYVNATVVRFCSVLGPHYSHGHVIDFMLKLIADPTQIELLGTGTQRKAYIHVEDVVRAIKLLLPHESPNRNFSIFNVGTDNYANPRTTARWVAEALGIEDPPQVSVTGESWPGDNPDIRLDTYRLHQLGWSTKWSIEDSIKDTVKWLTSAPSS